jgi:hypothetical protein
LREDNEGGAAVILISLPDGAISNGAGRPTRSEAEMKPRRLVFHRRISRTLNGAVGTALLLLLQTDCAPAQSATGSLGAANLMSVTEARQFFACKTSMSFAPGHGTQVSYLQPDGMEFLWYPGNAVVLPARWDIVARTTRTEPRKEYADICFKYGTNTYNPVTNQVGGKWECRPAHFNARFTVDRADGDIFGLAKRRTVPFVLSPERTSIAELRQKLPLSESHLGVGTDSGCPPAVSWGFASDFIDGAVRGALPKGDMK